MENSERYETFSPTEMAALKKKSLTYTIGLFLMILFAGFAALLVRHAAWTFIIIIILGTLFVIWFIARGQLRSILSLNRDIRDGKKKIVVDQMESQRQDIRATGNISGDGAVEQLINPDGANRPSMSYAYLLKVKGKEYNVSELQYYQCKPGQMVEIHLAPHSEHVFYVNILKDAATARATP